MIIKFLVNVTTEKLAELLENFSEVKLEKGIDSDTSLVETLIKFLDKVSDSKFKKMQKCHMNLRKNILLDKVSSKSLLGLLDKIPDENLKEIFR